jgi:hypothetical protein
MITADDYKFHDRDPGDDTWAETTFLIFSVPELAISGNIYVLARPNLGICHASIEIHQGICLHPWELHHNDAQMHLRCPEDYSDYTLANGLTFKAHDEREHHWRYEARDGNCALDLTYSAICEPTDARDPAQVPQAAEKFSGYSGWNNGHLEGKGRVLGSLRLRDRTYAVDCIDGVNKSWGPRNDWGNKGGTWVHVDLGEGLRAFLILDIAFEGRDMVYGAFRYGYVLVNGERRPLMAGAMTARRSYMLATSAEVWFEDDRGTRWSAHGTTVAAGPWYNFNPSSCAYQVLMRWEADGRVGYGHIADFVGQGAASRHRAEALYGGEPVEEG